MKRKDLSRVFKLIPHERALRKLLDAARVKPLGHEEVILERSVGRILNENIVSEVNIPTKRGAVFDGYAIRSSDTKGASKRKPVILKVVGKTFPGDIPLEVSSGQAVYTACGAPMPKGADAVIKVENIRLLQEEIEIPLSVGSGKNVASVGEDVERGGLLFKKGHILRPQDAGLLAGLGFRSVKVFKKPMVGIISVGDELVQLSEEKPLEIVNNYALIVSNLVSEYGGAPKLYGIAPDDLEKIKERISEALEEMDVVTTIAGCSVGQKDLVPNAIESLGAPGIIFHGISVSPGKVAGAGVVEGKPIVMLPGHIVSTCVGFYLFIVPLIAQHSGIDAENLFSVVKARIATDVNAKPTATFLRVRLSSVNDELTAMPVHGGSSSLTSLVNSNGYTIIPKGTGLRKGRVVDVVLYNRHELARLRSS